MRLHLLAIPTLLGGLAMAGTPPAGGERAGLTGRRAAIEPARIRADTVRVRIDTVLEYHGLYESGFEVSWFHPCDATPGDDTWWVTLTNDALRQRDSLAKSLTGKPRSVLVRWKATVGPKMPPGAGHMGRGSRYMLVTKVLSLRAADGAGCTSA
jgi:hypothetical protein